MTALSLFFAWLFFAGAFAPGRPDVNPWLAAAGRSMLALTAVALILHAADERNRP